MKKLLLVLLMACAAYGQEKDSSPRTLAVFTVATLPAAASWTNNIVLVTDGNAAGDCTTGTGAVRVVCVSDGTVWSSVGGSGGGGSSTISMPIFITFASCLQDGSTALFGSQIQTSGQHGAVCGNADYTKLQGAAYITADGNEWRYDITLGQLQGWNSGLMSATLATSFNTDTNTAHIANMNVSMGCRKAGSGTLTKFFDTAQTFVVNPVAVAGQIISSSWTSLTNTSSCGPTDLRILRLSRQSGTGGDNATVDQFLYSMTVNYTKSLP